MILREKKVSRVALQYLRKFGLKRSTAAALLYISRRIDSQVDIGEVDALLDKKPRPSEKRLVRREFLNYDFGQHDLNENKELMNRWKAQTHRTFSSVNWLLPDYHSLYAGGIYTALRFANAFAGRGILNRIIIFNGPYHHDEDVVASEIRSIFPKMEKLEVVINPSRLPSSDICIATFWPTAYVALKCRNTRGKYYLIQDFEPLFYAAGPYYALAEATYRFGLLGITNGPRLKEIYEASYHTDAEYFFPTPDRDVFYPSSDTPRTKVFRIFFYARPAMERNAFDLGILALQKLKDKHPELEITTAGWDLSDCEIPFEARNLGLLTLQQTAELYRTCDIGLVFMFTRHPSYLPLELMASGCIVITNKNADNTWLLQDRENCLLTEPAVSSIVETFELAMKDYDLRKSIVAKGLETVRQTDWDTEIRRIMRFITGQ